MRRHRVKLACFESVYRRLGNHMRINVKESFARLLTREYISKLSRLTRFNYGWRCVYHKLHVDASILM